MCVCQACERSVSNVRDAVGCCEQGGGGRPLASSSPLGPAQVLAQPLFESDVSPRAPQPVPCLRGLPLLDHFLTWSGSLSRFWDLLLFVEAGGKGHTACEG